MSVEKTPIEEKFGFHTIDRELPHLRRRLVFILCAIVGVLTFGTLGFVLVEGWSFFDAFYMSLMTMTTVGYKEVHDLSLGGRIFNSFLILFGVLTLFLAVGAMTQTAIELEFTNFFEKRRTRKMIDQLSRHYIVCGFGRVGRGAAAELQRSGEPFIVMDRDEGRVERAIRLGMTAVLGDATRDEYLQEVGISRAKGLIATLATDADNLFVVLSAKGLNPAITVSSRVIEEEAEAKLRRAGADTVFAPYNLMGSRLARAIVQPHVVQFLDFAVGTEDEQVNLEQIRVGERSEYAGKTLGETGIRKELGVIVLAIRKREGQMIVNPEAAASIEAGDYLIAMGDSPKLRQLERMMAEVS
jgi:voltage-gated potassium channel